MDTSRIVAESVTRMLLECYSHVVLHIAVLVPAAAKSKTPPHGFSVNQTHFALIPLPPLLFYFFLNGHSARQKDK